MCFFRNSTIRNPTNSDIVHTNDTYFSVLSRVLITGESAPGVRVMPHRSQEDLKFKVMSDNCPYS